MLKQAKVLILIRNSHESVRDCDVRDVPDIMECGGKRSTTPLCRKSRQVVRQEPAIPARPKAPSPLRSAGALHRLWPLSKHTRHFVVRVVYKDEGQSPRSSGRSQRVRKRQRTAAGFCASLLNPIG
jgi:hypothetical protein